MAIYIGIDNTSIGRYKLQSILELSAKSGNEGNTLIPS